MKDLIEVKILIVDDDAKARDFLENYFVKEKCAVRTANNGRNALFICEKFRPQIVLLDINMPVMNGVQVLKRIKAKFPEIGVIMTTGEGSLKATRETLEHGAFTHIIKPIDLDKLAEVVRRALGKDKGFETKTIKNQNQEDKKLLEDFQNETANTKIDALIAVLNENGLVTERELLEKINKIKGLK